MRRRIVLAVLLGSLFLLVAACGGGQEAPTSTPLPPTPAPAATPEPTATVPSAPTTTSEPTPAPAEAADAHMLPVDFTAAEEIPAEASYAVDLLAAWVDAEAPESDPFSYAGFDGNTYEASFAEDVLPLFTEANLWYLGAPSCVSCHHANLENSYHEMDLSSYEGILAGGDRLSEPPGVPMLGQS